MDIAMSLTSRAGIAFFSLFTMLLSADTIRGGGRERYAVVLEDPPVAVSLEANVKLGSRAGEDRRAAIVAKQAMIREKLAERKIEVNSAEQMLVNAIFITADPAEADALRAMAGVRRVERLYPLKRSSNAAINLVEAPAGWARVQGGEGQAGAGIRIGIIDTGIDHRHPAFDGAGFAPPAGFPRCGPGIDCARWTNGKVIVARSYVEQLNFAFGTNAADTRPDDNSPRDRVGHGTAAAMMAAGRRVRGPSAEVVGVAPRAFLGNYKVFGSPGVNDSTYSPVIINALTDAINDGMDIVTLNLGRPSLWPSLARTCGDSRNLACDIEAEAVHNATLRGLVVVAAAGNSGNTGFNYPALGTVQSPAVAPGAIAVGATTNSHVWFQSFSIPGAGGGLNPANVRFSDGPRLRGPLTAPVRDVATVGDDTNGRACRPLPAGSLTGTIALVQRGDCERSVKVNYAQAAGAVAVVFQQTDGVDFLFTPGGLSGTGIPSALIGSTAGRALRSYLQTNRDAQGTLNPAVREVPADADFVADFSARGPTNGDMLIKPELTAPGTDLFMAAQSFDPNGALYDPSGYTVSQGTSFAAPMVAGAAALVKQRFPNASPAVIKSILAGTTEARLSDVNNSGNRVDARVLSVGGGRLNVNRALQTNIATEPATISFGVVRAGPNPNTGLVVRNLQGTSVQVRVEVQPVDRDPNLRMTVSNTNFTLNPQGSAQLTVRLEGNNLPPVGQYTGDIVLTTSATTLRVPYLYIVGENVVNNAYPIANDFFVVPTGGRIGAANCNQFDVAGLGVKVTDRSGAPVDRQPVRYEILEGGGSIICGAANTDSLGIADASLRAGATEGRQLVRATLGNTQVFFEGFTRTPPETSANRIVNAATNQPAAAGRGFAPGSYIAIYGSRLSDSFQVFSTPTLPVSLAGVSVSFDNEANRISVPGRITFVSDGQINVQIPWECQGLTQVQIKVAIGNIQSREPITIPIANVSPGAFEYTDSNGQLSVAALDQAFQLLTPANPARRGQAIQLYYNGLGAVDNQPESGGAAPSQEPLARTRVVPTVTIGGRPAQVLFSGLAPGFVGLYQVNVIVPGDAPAGRQPVGLSINGVEAPNTFVAVQ